MKYSIAIACLLSTSYAYKLVQGQQGQNQISNQQKLEGIFSKMIEMAEAPEKAEQEKHEATLRK